MIKTEYPDMKKIVSEIVKRIDVKEIANIIRDDIQVNFDKGLNADGTKMTQLKASTVKVKQKQGGISPKSPLVFKGGSKKGIKSTRINDKEAVITSTGMAKGYYGGGISSQEVLKIQSEKGRDPFGISDTAFKKVEQYIKKQLGR